MHRGARLLIFGVACTGLAQVQAQADWRFAHPNADLRMSVNVQAVLKAPAVTEMLKANQPEQVQPEQIRMVLGLLSSVDRISISARQTGKDSDVLALVTGNFDASSIQALFPSRGAGQVKQVSPHAVLIGEGASFAQSVQRMAGGTATGPSEELEQSDLWISGSTAWMPEQPTQPTFKALRRFSFGMNLGVSPEMSVVLSAADADGAAQLLSALREMLGPLGQAIDGSQEGAKVRLHFVVPPEMMRAARTQAASGSFAEQLQPLMGMLGLAGAHPETGGKIVIYGLDDGPREVKTK